ncbi:MAG: TlpA family protein disulfide reductase [Sandaracinaceae bacterium]|nr:TlpA family protein disulfide reductase [Sandaracinaceae bacterium]
MDRLPALIALAIALGGCDDGRAASGAPPSRVVAVSATEEEAGDDLCDVAHDASSAPALAFPELGAGTAPGAASGPRWINVWATWCRPCVEEMPMLRAWAERMGAEGAGVELVFLSADASDEAIATFRETHPDAPASLRVADPAALPAWVTTVGLDEGATLPIHVLTDARAAGRAARAPAR